MVLPQKILTRLQTLADAILNKINSKIETHNKSDTAHEGKFVKVADNYKHAHGYILQDGTVTQVLSNNQSISGVLVSDNTNKIKKMGKLPASAITHQDISGKLDKNQTTANAGKFMKVNSEGEITPESITIPGINVIQTKQNSNTVEEIGSINGTKLYCNKDTTYTPASNTTSGLMTKEQYSKLNGIKEGANNTTFNRILNTGSKIGTIITDGNSTDVYVPNYTGADGIKIESNVFKHVNSIQSKTTAGLYKIAYDGQGHITNAVGINIDSTPTANSTNLVTSGGITQALNAIRSEKTYTASDGIKLESNIFKHTNSITKQNTPGLYKIAYDAQGHITNTTTMGVDNTPKTNSTNLITSGGVEQAIAGVDSQITNLNQQKQNVIPDVATTTLKELQDQSNIKFYKWGKLVICSIYMSDGHIFTKSKNEVQSQVSAISNAIPEGFRPSSVYSKNTDILSIMSDDSTINQYTARIYVELENSSEKYQIKGRSRYSGISIKLRGQLIWFTD